MPLGFTAHPGITVVTVDMGGDPQAGLNAIFEYANKNRMDILVVGCEAVADNVSLCDGLPFVIYGSQGMGDKAARK